MNWKNRLTNYNFWISIFSATLLILQALKIEFDIAYVNEIFTAVLGLLVVIGIISDPTRTTVKTADSSSAKTQKHSEKEIEEKNVEVVNENNVQTENAMPIDAKDAIDNVNDENDFEVLLDKISTELNSKIAELEKNNLELLKKITEKQELKKEVENIDMMETVQPAVAEMDNPYFM